MRRTSSILATALLLTLAQAAHAAERHRLNLPGGRLGDAIIALGRQAGVSVGVSDPALAAENVSPVRGTMTAEQALRRMLRDSGARFVTVDDRTFRVVRRPASRRLARRATWPAPPPAPPPQVQEEAIYVTGTRRPIRLASYAGGAEIVLGTDPELLLGLRGSDVLSSRLPVVTSTHLGTGRNKLFIRGVADSSFSGTVQATTGQYLGETRLNYNSPDPDLRLYDVERIEVLPGPQGTLYGAGSLGGIIRILPNPPDAGEVEGIVSAGVSLTEHGDPGADAAAMLNLPLVSDRLGLRVVGYGATEGGYIDDTGRGLQDVNRVRTYGGRAALRLHAGDGWTFDAAAAMQRIRGEDAQFADRDAPPLTRESAIAQPFESDYWLADLTIRKEWGATRFVASAGIVRHEIRETYDSTMFGGAVRAFAQDNRIELISVEARLSGEGERLVDWVVGTSFVSNESRQRRRHGLAEDPDPIPGVRNEVQEMALFGEGRFRLAPGIIFTAGGRLAHSRVAGESLDVTTLILPPLLGRRADRNQAAFLPSVGLSGEVSPDLVLFARYQESFRPGGLSVSDEFVQRFRSDDLATLEAGARYGRPGIGRFDASAVVAYTRWEDIQADTVTLTGFPITANIGNGRIYSLDLRLGWRPIDGLTFEAAALLNDSRVTNPIPTIDIVAGAPLPNVAGFSGRLGAEYGTAINDALDLRLHAAARYVGESRLGVGTILGEAQGGFLDVSLGAALDRGRHTLSLGVTNLLDEVGNRFAVGSPFTLLEQRQITPLRPRTVRLGWQVRF